MDCVIVDDNKLAIIALKEILCKIDSVNVLKTFTESVEAFKFIKENKIDIAFLDVEMPNMSGIDIIENLDNKPFIVFVSSKKDYALDAFNLDVTDFVLKPVNFARVNKTIDKIKDLLKNQETKVESIENEQFFFVRSGTTLNKIEYKTLTHIQAYGDYVNLYTEDSKFIVHHTMKFFEEKLPKNQFMRVHRSYILDFNKITKIEDDSAYLGKHPVPISEQYKTILLRKLNMV